MTRSQKLAGAVFLLLVAGQPAQASETVSYTYDAQGRLTNVVHSGSVNDAAESNYIFDSADNRTNVTVAKANSRVVVVPINGLTVIPIPDP